MSWKHRQTRVRASALTVVFPVRAPETVLDRLEWLIRNDEATTSRSQASRDGLRDYVERREEACRREGLTPPAPKA